MEKEKINQFLMVNGKNFPETAIPSIRRKMEEMNDDQFDALSATEWKSPTVAFLLAFFLGGLGGDRFYLEQTGLGVAKLLTCGGFGLWSLIDLFTCFGRAKLFNYNKFQFVC